VSSQLADHDGQKKALASLGSDAGVASVPRKPAGKKHRAITRVDPAQAEVSLPAPKSDAGEKKEAKLSPLAFLSREKPAAEPDPPAAADGAALITLAIAPWGEVYVDGDRIGVSPPVNEVEVAPGKRKIEIRNGTFPVFTQFVEVKADQKIRIKHKF
jgi:serine/threonine-protein kinase